MQKENEEKEVVKRMNDTKLANLVLPNVRQTTDDYESMYPERKLPKGAEVTRIAPSPTGLIHLGVLFSALADERIAHQSGGTFYLRIEDTDQKRKVEGAVDAILKALDYFHIPLDEGADVQKQNLYGPYYQRERAKIYQSYAKLLIQKGLAYPCFCTEEELSKIRNQQMAEHEMTGYHAKYAKCRELTLEEVQAKIEAKLPYVIRLKSQGSLGGSVTIDDALKGEIRLPANVQDIVLLKTDGIPTYHFAHAIDDHLMHTTLVLRGEEWLSSVPIHIELFDALGFTLPRYAHTSQLMKMDGNSKRKLSKRKDPECSLEYYRKDGYHPNSIKLYLMTLLNSNFEQWYLKHPEKTIEDFPFDVSKMSQAGALFDLEKLHNICKNEFANMTVDEVYEFLYQWSLEYLPEKISIYFEDAIYMKKVLALCMGVEEKRKRKDFIYARQILDHIHYFFEASKLPKDTLRFDWGTVTQVLRGYLSTYKESDTKEEWFQSLRDIAKENGFAEDMKKYKLNPEKYKGNISDVAEIIRIALTGRTNTPDLWSITKLIGEQKMRQRIETLL